MIYGEFETYPRFKELVRFLQTHFDDVQWGSQCDDWIWIFDHEMKVAMDNFTSHDFQIKLRPESEPLLARIVEVLTPHYRVQLWPTPELEAHEDD